MTSVRVAIMAGLVGWVGITVSPPLALVFFGGIVMGYCHAKIEE